MTPEKIALARWLGIAAGFMVAEVTDQFTEGLASSPQDVALACLLVERQMERVRKEFLEGKGYD